MRHALPVIEIFGVPIVRATVTQALEAIERLAESGRPALVAYANAHSLELSEQDPGFKAVLKEAAMVLNDGVGVSVAAKLIAGQSFPANLNGTDLTPRILDLAAEKQWRVFFLGAEAGVAETAKARLREINSGLLVVGTHSGFFPASETGNVVQQIREAETDLLLVAMGNPAQEKWLARHLEETGAKIGIGVGAFLDFTAGLVRRAPTWMRDLKIEWLYRVSCEPGRLWKRYFVGGPVFLARVALATIARRL